MAATNSTTFPLAVPAVRVSSRDLTELILPFLMILAVLWLPTREQAIFGPIALLIPLVLTLLDRPGLGRLGLGWRGLMRSLWILPASGALMALGVFVSRAAGTYHHLHQPEFGHVGGYVVWTLYQQFLLQDYFMPRLGRVMSANNAVIAAAVLFALAHLPNLVLTAATLLWGVASCLLFRRYRSLWVLGVAQGLLGLCFATCVPDALLHHMRVGLGYLRYQPIAGQAVGIHGAVSR